MPNNAVPMIIWIIVKRKTGIKDALQSKVLPPSSITSQQRASYPELTLRESPWWHSTRKIVSMCADKSAKWACCKEYVRLTARASGLTPFSMSETQYERACRSSWVFWIAISSVIVRRCEGRIGWNKSMTYEQKRYFLEDIYRFPSRLFRIVGGRHCWRSCRNQRRMPIADGGKEVYIGRQVEARCLFVVLALTTFQNLTHWKQLRFEGSTR